MPRHQSDDDLAKGAGDIVPLKRKKYFRGLPHYHRALRCQGLAPGPFLQPHGRAGRESGGVPQRARRARCGCGAGRGNRAHRL